MSARKNIISPNDRQTQRATTLRLSIYGGNWAKAVIRRSRSEWPESPRHSHWHSAESNPRIYLTEQLTSTGICAQSLFGRNVRHLLTKAW